MWSVESGIQDDLRLTSSVQSFQVSLLEQANVLQTLEYFFRDRVITVTVDSVMIKTVLFFFQTVLNSTLQGLCYLRPQLHTASQEA